MAEFVRAAVSQTLAINRSLDRFPRRYPNYTDRGIVSKRGRRPGSVPEGTPGAGRDIVLRAPVALVDEVHGLVIHRNDGTGDGPATVSAFVAHAIHAALTRARRQDGITGRYPATGSEERLAHLDARSAISHDGSDRPGGRRAAR